MQTRTLVAMGLVVVSCGPLPPSGGSGESATEGEPTTGEPTSGGPTSGEPTSGGPTTEPQTSSTTWPQGECSFDSDCSSYGECTYCIDGACVDSPGCCGLMPGPDGDLQLRCIGYECYSDSECSDGEICENAPGFCSPIPPLPACEPQVLSLSALMLGGIPSAVAVLDVDVDGALDVVAALPDEGLVHVALGDGKGAFASVGSFPTKLEPGAHRIAWADFDGDGDPDLAISRPVPTGELALLFGQDAVFGDPVLTTLGSSPSEVWAGDVDGDGDADLIAHNQEGPAPLTLRLGDGLGGFGDELGGDQLEFESFAAAAGDVDGDATLEVVTSVPGGPQIRVVKFQDGGFAVGEPLAIDGFTPQDALVIGRLDGDATGDVASLRSLESGLVTLWTGLKPTDLLAFDGAVQLGPVGDVDGDGAGDMVTLAADPLLLRVAYTGAARCVQALPLPLPSAPVLLATGDLDGDGKADIVAASFAGPEVSILRSGP